MDNVRKALPFVAIISLPPVAFIADRTRFFGIFSKKAFEGAEELPSLALNRKVVVLWFQNIGEKAIRKLGSVAAHPATMALALIAVIYCIGRYRKEIQKAWNTINPYARIAELETQLAKKAPVPAHVDFTTTEAYLTLQIELKELKEKTQCPPGQPVEDRITPLLSRIEKLEQRLSAITQPDSKAQQELLSLKDRFEKLEKQQSSTTQSVEDPIQPLRERIGKLENSLTTLSTDTAIKQELASLTQRCEKLETQQSQAIQELKSSLEEKISEISSTVTKLLESLAQQSKKTEGLQTNYGNLDGRVSQLEKDIKAKVSSAEMEAFTSQVSSLKLELEKMQQQNQQAAQNGVSQEEERKNQITLLQESLSKLEKGFEKLNATVDSKVAEKNSLLVTQFSELKQQLETLKSQLPKQPQAPAPTIEIPTKSIKPESEFKKPLSASTESNSESTTPTNRTRTASLDSYAKFFSARPTATPKTSSLESSTSSNTSSAVRAYAPKLPDDSTNSVPTKQTEASIDVKG